MLTLQNYQKRTSLSFISSPFVINVGMNNYNSLVFHYYRFIFHQIVVCECDNCLYLMSQVLAILTIPCIIHQEQLLTSLPQQPAMQLILE